MSPERVIGQRAMVHIPGQSGGNIAICAAPWLQCYSLFILIGECSMRRCDSVSMRLNWSRMESTFLSMEESHWRAPHGIQPTNTPVTLMWRHIRRGMPLKKTPWYLVREGSACDEVLWPDVHQRQDGQLDSVHHLVNKPILFLCCMDATFNKGKYDRQTVIVAPYVAYQSYEVPNIGGKICLEFYVTFASKTHKCTQNCQNHIGVEAVLVWTGATESLTISVCLCVCVLFPIFQYCTVEVSFWGKASG